MDGAINSALFTFIINLHHSRNDRLSRCETKLKKASQRLGCLHGWQRVALAIIIRKIMTLNNDAKSAGAGA
jgi:hypothetical protein